MRGLSPSTTKAEALRQTLIHLSTLWLLYPSEVASECHGTSFTSDPAKLSPILLTLTRSKNDYLGVLNAEGELQSLGKITPEFDLMVTGGVSSKLKAAGQSSVIEERSAAEEILEDPDLTEDAIYLLISEYLHLSSTGVLYTTLKHILRHHALPEFVYSPGSDIGLMMQLKLVFPKKEACDPKKALEIVRRIWTRIVQKWEKLPEIPDSYDNEKAERFIDLSLAMFGISDCFTTPSEIHQYLQDTAANEKLEDEPRQVIDETQDLKDTAANEKLEDGPRQEIDENHMYVAGGYCFSLADGSVRDCMTKEYRETLDAVNYSRKLLYCIIDMLNFIASPRGVELSAIWRANELMFDLPNLSQIHPNSPMIRQLKSLTKNIQKLYEDTRPTHPTDKEKETLDDIIRRLYVSRSFSSFARTVDCWRHMAKVLDDVSNITAVGKDRRINYVIDSLCGKLSARDRQESEEFLTYSEWFHALELYKGCYQMPQGKYGSRKIPELSGALVLLGDGYLFTEEQYENGEEYRKGLLNNFASSEELRVPEHWARPKPTPFCHAKEPQPSLLESFWNGVKDFLHYGGPPDTSIYMEEEGDRFSEMTDSPDAYSSESDSDNSILNSPIIQLPE